MQTKTDKVRAAIADCDHWYHAAGRDIRTLTERIEELWFEVDDCVEALQTAEANHDRDAVLCCLAAIRHRLERIHQEAGQTCI